MAEGEIAGRSGRQGVSRPQVRKERWDAVMTAEKRRAFLAELARTCNVAASARALNVPENTVRALARRNAEFGAGVRAALAEGYATLEFALLEVTLKSVGAMAGDPMPGGVDGAGDAAPPRFDPKAALALLNAHRDTVAKERARVGEARGVGAQRGGGAVKRLLARLEEMGERMRAEDAEG